MCFPNGFVDIVVVAVVVAVDFSTMPLTYHFFPATDLTG